MTPLNVHIVVNSFFMKKLDRSLERVILPDITFGLRREIKIILKKFSLERKRNKKKEFFILLSKRPSPAGKAHTMNMREYKKLWLNGCCSVNYKLCCVNEIKVKFFRWSYYKRLQEREHTQKKVNPFLSINSSYIKHDV